MRISLDTGWYYASTADFADALPVPVLSNLAGNSHQTTYLKCSFNLETTDYCVNYILHMETAPAGLHLSINGQPLPIDSGPPYRVDVTLLVRLDDNEMVIQIPPRASGSVVGLALEPLPCD